MRDRRRIRSRHPSEAARARRAGDDGADSRDGTGGDALKLVQVPGAGVDRIDRAALPAGAVLANAYGHEVGIAEYVIGVMLALTREFSRLDAALRRGDWQSRWAVGTPPPPLWPELSGRTIGILGYGRIGQNIARRARAFDMQVCAIRRDIGQSMEGRWRCSEARTFSTRCWSAPITSSVDAGQSADGRLDWRAELRRMKPSAYLINVARGEIVDEDALYHALARRTIAGAALDVWYRYPREPGATAPATARSKNFRTC